MRLKPILKIHSLKSDQALICFQINPVTLTGMPTIALKHINSTVFAPEATIEKAWLKHKPIKTITENSMVEIALQYVAPTVPKGIKISGFSGGKRVQYEMSSSSDYQYNASIPADVLKEGF